jgi:cytochrome c
MGFQSILPVLRIASRMPFARVVFQEYDMTVTDVLANASAIVLCLLAASAPAHAAGDASRGATAFQACASCHSVNPGEQLTGPSLANVWHQKAGTVPGFARYSEAMKKASIVWDENTLDRWLANPSAVIPGTSMTFPGIPDAAVRQDVIAYLKSASEGNAPSASRSRAGMMMGQPSKLNLKQAPPEGHVVSIAHCRDTYSVKTADGKVNKVWEFNLRFKTDSSNLGPETGKPVIVGAGMQGDRASVVFAKPSEISSFVKESCP